ncbi:unnamed protein product [Caenorhabditis bovis]|uniref:Serpentine receptor class gamma n=1 Tax=Caenorhabditis bovis TaxID=2654633 RepID=A0A8S1F2D3_9PELO|nr:unnamed protein product [Caenorhabditis bovis]
MSVSVLATNRLSALLAPNNYQKMWRSYRFWIGVAIQLIPGCAMAISTFFNSTQLYRNDSGGIVPKFIKYL